MVAPPTCDGFNFWIENALLSYYKSTNDVSLHDCHLIPQWEYAKFASHILSFKRIRSSAFWETLSRHFNANITQVHELATASDPKFCGEVLSEDVRKCISKNNLLLLKLHFRDDFRHLRQYF